MTVMTKNLAAVLTATAALASACTVHQTEPPPLQGPSELAQSVTVTATPDTIKLGMSSSSYGDSAQIVVQLRGPDGSAIPNKAIRLDLLPSGCGFLSASQIVSGSDGRAVATFTAPGTPLPMPDCSNFDGTVTVFANVLDSNFQTAVFHSASIRLVAPTVIVAPGAATVNFTISPNPAKVLAEVTFADAGSVAAPGRTIQSYVWDFSDGISKRGAIVQHDFGSPGTYGVTLTITDDIGQSTFKTSSVTITS
jgi:PKD domain-containing protein